MVGAAPDETWVPVNSQFRMSSDAYFYGAAVTEMREHLFTHALPATEAGGPVLAFDGFRASTYRALALAELFVPDPRYAYLWAFLLSFVVNFLLLWWLGRELGLSRLAATVAALAVVFWERLPQYIDPLPGNTAYVDYFRAFVSRFMSGGTDFESFNNHTRFAILSGAICFLWIFLIAVVRFDAAPTRRRALLVAITGLMLLYAYPAIAVVGACVGTAYLAAAIVRRDPVRLGLLFAAASAAILAALFLGVVPEAAAALGPGGTLEAHPDVRAGGAAALAHVARDRSLTVLLTVVLTALALVRREAPRLRLLAGGVIVAGAVLLAAQLVPRAAATAELMQVRGYGSLVLFAIVALTVKLIAPSPESIPSRRVVHAARMAVLGCLALATIVPAAIGDVALARTLTTSDELHVPTAQWDAYEYLRAHARANDVVLAIDWEDVQLLPVYTDVDLYFGDVSFTGRSQVDEASRYFRAWTSLGLPDDLLRARLATAVKDGQRVGGATPQRSLPRPDAEGPMVLRHLFYDPYIITFDGIPIRDSSGSDLNPEFLRRIFTLMDESRGVSALADPAVTWIMVSRDYEALRSTPNGDPPGFHAVLRTDVRTIYARDAG